ncbi:MAG: hypothetical protein AAFP90_20855, partial [Planctomycetota bacterium]
MPFFSGAFDDPNYDDVNDPTAHAGITCTVCHAIQSVGSTKGNADYVIDEPRHYPFAYSENSVLKWLNHLMVKAKPAFHKHEMLKPFHKSKDGKAAEFCGTCHKVSLPGDVTDYKEFLRGQNHYDSFLLSGVSGHGARSFYYPPVAHTDCNGCHMPLMASDHFGAKYDEKLGATAVHNHAFPAANTAVGHWLNDDKMVRMQQQYLKDTLRVDLFGLRQGDRVDDPLIAPLRPELPSLEPGKTYLVETVLRTLSVGHHFTQGTSDSNEVWVQLTVKSNDRVIAINGRINEDGSVDPSSHFVNTFMLDKEGRQIDRRNAQDIYTPLYSNQMPPGTGQTMHYRFTVPDDASGTVEITARLLYRKFNARYMDYIRADRDPAVDRSMRGLDPETTINDLPVTEIASDKILLPIAGSEIDADTQDAIANQKRDIPVWQRWNDYGIGLLLKGKAELKSSSAAFEQVHQLGRYDGRLNLARIQLREGEL